ncbi:uncharacterized protein EAF01_003458 [Botrytis porri]|uniref:Uncharacterized protein n=1 Tax=Botrytis porri TaxID=87229 RepID=A0A4Z1L1F0_9HELO|nr:uncharacterized protein EAF01_003458 [Botrytis porri]KAF7909740.1 hypothetical protein EAF01_003458 [Botrytis porri]TGO90662.1 hypothetical protein BPOR_0055g00050 [Botrytis porri]
MAQAQQPKTPLEILQIQINAILIETGKALRATGAEGGKSMAISAIRLHSTIPSITDNFHRALDDLEAEIIRAKSVLGRDLEELRSKRIAAENPPAQNIENPVVHEPTPPPHISYEDIPSATKQETIQDNDPMPTIAKEEETPIKNEMAREIRDEEETKEPTTSSPPSTNDNKSQPIGLGINTTLPASTDAPETATGGGQDSSIDSLFDNPDSAANADSAALNFESMDFSMLDAATNTQSQDNNHTQNTEFDLSTFGSNPQDFNMNDLQPSNEASNNNNNNHNSANITTTTSKGDIMDDILNMAARGDTNDNNNNNDNNMDMDSNLDNMVGADESVFDDLFFENDDDGNVGGEIGEMEHGQFDSAFFGID